MKHSILCVSALTMTGAIAISSAHALAADPDELVLDDPSAEGMPLAAEADGDGAEVDGARSYPSPYPANALEVTKTANTSFERRWKWKLDKKSDIYDLYLAHKESKPVEYWITAKTDGYKDSGWVVSGEIYVKNKTYYTATITGVEDVITSSYGDPIYVDPKCNVYFPYYLKPGETLKCTYYQALTDGKPRVNKATVKTKGAVVGGTATAPVKFDYPKQEVDRCANVEDTTGEQDLGYVCANEAPKTWKIWLDVGPYYLCGEHYFTNHAKLVTKDTYTVEKASHTINVKVKCDGCPKTQGYWKTHSKYGPAAKPDSTWDSVGGPNAKFFNTGKTWLEMFNTPPKGDATIILAVQYMAATLSLYSGVDGSYVKDELESARKFFESYKPGAYIEAKKRDELLYLADILDKFNNGLLHDKCY